MTRITVDVNDEWLEAAREILGTNTKVATINAALQSFGQRKKAAEIMALLDSAEMDHTGSAEASRRRRGATAAAGISPASSRRPGKRWPRKKPPRELTPPDGRRYLYG